MSVRLTVKQRSEAGGAEKGTEILLDDPSITLGRDKTCQVVLAEQAVSRTHARISRDGTLFFLEDLGSAYGTQVNGKKLPKGEKRLLRDGDVIAIAQFDVTFGRVLELPPSTEKTSFVARQMVKDVMKGLGGAGPFFRTMNGPNEGKRIEINEAQELIVGRDPSGDVVLDDDLVSRRHAKIRRDWSGTHVEDLESRNGIKVNKKRVLKKTLRDQDELQIGSTRFLYLDPSEVRDAAVDEPEEGEVTDPPKSEAPPPEPPPPAEAAQDEAPPPPPPEPSASSQPETSQPERMQEELPPEPEISAPREVVPVSPRARALALITMGLFGLVALAMIIAVLVGA
jgi:pSer/pThr/pTyr-binding forkhead associated (FHA) protein